MNPCSDHLPALSVTLEPSQTVKPRPDGSHLNLSAIQKHAFASRPQHIGVGIKYVLSGEEVYVIDGQRHRVGAEQHLIVNPGQSLSVMIQSCERAYGACVYFAPEDIAEVVRQLESSPGRLLDEPSLETAPPEFVNCVSPAINDRIGGLLRQWVGPFARTHQAPQDMEPAIEELFMGLMEALASIHVDQRRAMEQMTAQRPAVRAETYRRLMLGRAYLHDRWNQPYDLSETGAEAALSPFYFHRLFRTAFGVAPYAYVLGLRIDAAKELLAQGMAPDRVARETGFESYDSFRKAFRRMAGHSPTAWLERGQKTSLSA